MTAWLGAKREGGAAPVGMADTAGLRGGRCMLPSLQATAALACNSGRAAEQRAAAKQPRQDTAEHQPQSVNSRELQLRRASSPKWCARLSHRLVTFHSHARGMEAHCGDRGRAQGGARAGLCRQVSCG